MENSTELMHRLPEIQSGGRLRKPKVDRGRQAIDIWQESPHKRKSLAKIDQSRRDSRLNCFPPEDFGLPVSPGRERDALEGR